jgi:parallel beta-helix repeat protein
VIVAFPNIEIVKAEETIYIRANGSVDPATAPISTVDNITYTLIDNTNGSIEVERSEIILDGAGYTLEGTGNENGLILSNINNVTIKNLKLSSFNIGIVVMGSNNNSILENTLTDNFRGLDLTSSENNTVSGNYIANNEDGISLENIHNDLIGNTITNNTDSGIFLNGAGYNNIIGNNITDNSRGISVSISDANVIYHNNFANNTNHVKTDNSIGIWDNGEEGNYWDNYTGLDNNGDGLGDTPYIIDENNQDNYPLTNVIPEFPSWIILPLVLVVTLFGVILRKKFRSLE